MNNSFQTLGNRQAQGSDSWGRKNKHKETHIARGAGRENQSG